MNYRRVPSSRETSGFTLLEVVVAIGIFAGGIVVILGLCAPLAHSARANADASAAVNTIEVLLSRLRNEPFNALAGWLKTPAEFRHDEDESAYDPAGDDRIFYANRTGDKIGRRNDPVWDGSDREKYFEITLIRNEELSPAAADAFATWLAFNARVRWPAFLPVAGGGVIQAGIGSSPLGGSPHDGKHLLLFSGSIRR